MNFPNNKFDKMFVLIEGIEVFSLAKEYNLYIPKFLLKIPESWNKIYDKNKISLFKISSIEEVKINY